MQLFVYVSTSERLKKKYAKRLIKAGHITVDDRPVDDPAFQVLLGVGTRVAISEELDASGAEDGPVQTRVLREPFHRLYVMNKPRSCLCTRARSSQSWKRAHGLMCKTDSEDDEQDEADTQKTVYDYIPPSFCHPSIGAFGRLDIDTTGVLLLGSDGDLQSALLHPSSQIPRTYVAELDPYHRGQHVYQVSISEAIDNLEKGVRLSNGHVCMSATMEVISTTANEQQEAESSTCTTDANKKRILPTKIRITVMEGKYHEVKRMLAVVGMCVVKLHRESFANCIRVDGMKSGELRQVSDVELRGLAEALRMGQKQGARS